MNLAILFDPCNTFTHISFTPLDCIYRGLGMMSVTSAFMEMLKSFSHVDQNHYPERNGGVYILNTPSAFPYVWRGVKTLMNPRTTAKINIYSSPKVCAIYLKYTSNFPTAPSILSVSLLITRQPYFLIQIYFNDAMLSGFYLLKMVGI